MTHPLLEDIRLFAVGALGGADLLIIDHHLESCDSCRRQAMAQTWPFVLTDDMPAPDDFAAIEHLIARAALDPTPADPLIEYLRQAHEATSKLCRVDRSNTNQRRLGRILIAESWALYAAGRYTTALEVARAAHDQFMEIRDEIEVGRALVAEGDALAEMNEFGDAANVTRMARAIFEKHGDIRRAYIAWGQEARILATAGRFDEAAELMEGLLSVVPMNDPHRAYWQHSLAAALALAGRNLDRAEELLNGILTLPEYRRDQSLYVRVRWTLAIIDIQRGRYDEGLDQLWAVYRDAVEAQFTSVVMSVRCAIADVLALLGRTEESVEHARAVINYFAREKMSRRTNEALAILREAAQRNAPVTVEDVRRFRAQFPNAIQGLPIEFRPS